ncbi:MAG TPA: Arm DNA-binding domain-containing protein, partial [Longimicrobiaceae bacterium]|nr:Arm DNA-binding domain-containing protein [Longimicrobiaceae bacterium]
MATERELDRITKRDVDALQWNPKGSAQQVLYDGPTGVPGFGCRVYPSGKKSFILRYRTRTGRIRLLTLGKYGPFTVQAAREMARDAARQVAA